jgi:6-phosphogluconolactonase (cycloisomerase 2 family)
MKTPVGLAVILAAAGGATALAAPALADPAHGGGAVFVATDGTDGTDGNSVIAYDSSLRRKGTYRTGGKGGVLNGSVADHVASQGALALDRDRNLLYAVNAGSDTLTVFGVHGESLSRLQVISTGGDFPVSVTSHGNAVYVLNARDGGSIQGYLRLGSRLVKVVSWHRNLNLPITTDSNEFTHTPGQIPFTPDGNRLIVTTKASTNTVEVFGVDRLSGPSSRPAATVLDGAVPFAVDFDSAGRAVIAEAGPNAVATFTINRDNKLTQVSSIATGQAATCWIAGANGVFYASNAGSGSVTAVQDSHGTLTAQGNTATAAGSVDVATSPDGSRLYTQGGADGTLVSFKIGNHGALSPLGSVTVPNSAGAEGIATS